MEYAHQNAWTASLLPCLVEFVLVGFAGFFHQRSFCGVGQFWARCWLRKHARALLKAPRPQPSFHRAGGHATACAAGSSAHPRTWRFAEQSPGNYLCFPGYSTRKASLEAQMKKKKMIEAIKGY